MRLRQLSREVAIADEPIVRITHADICDLKKRAMESPLGRSRICAHHDESDPLHEMLIAIARETYIRPHKHLAKSESFHVIEGRLDVVLFNEAGKVLELIPMGIHESGLNFFYRLAEPLFHTLLILSPIVVIHETTNGPFKRDDTIFAEWSPAESDTESVLRFKQDLTESIALLPGSNFASAQPR